MLLNVFLKPFDFYFVDYANMSSLPPGTYDATIGSRWARFHCKQFTGSICFMMLFSGGCRAFYYFRPLPLLREISTVVSFLAMFWAVGGYKVLYDSLQEVQLTRDMNMFYISAIKMDDSADE